MSAGSQGDDVDPGSEADGDTDLDSKDEGPSSAGELADLRARIDGLRNDLESFETDVEDRTVHRSEIESELRRYVRSRLRRGHARGWGPYLVLLYGTAMTLGAFYLLSGAWAILAMFVVWLSTLGLYTLMVIVGIVFGAASVPGRAIEWIRSR